MNKLHDALTVGAASSTGVKNDMDLESDKTTGLEVGLSRSSKSMSATSGSTLQHKDISHQHVR